MTGRGKARRYVLDPLYGVVHPPSVFWKVLPAVELQRLREVRLCNINSLILTGAACVNRFEHAVGTFVLATECLNSWPLDGMSDAERLSLQLAALLHDVVNGAFGHSIEYLESKKGFRPESAFRFVITGKETGSYEYRSATLEPMFYGSPGNLLAILSRELKLNDQTIEAVDSIIAGRPPLGPLINGSMDLDNIDNVYRLAYHMGLVTTGHTAIELARSIWVENGELMLKESALPLVEDWAKTRERLYSYLLLNPEEFAGKCMLTEALELTKKKADVKLSWHDTDAELLTKLHGGSSDVADRISRLVRGQLYGCVALFSSARPDANIKLLDPKLRTVIEARLEAAIRPASSAVIGHLPKSVYSAIRGTLGIAYDTTTGTLRVSTDVSEQALDSLASNELRPHAAALRRLFAEAVAKQSKFGVKNPSLALHGILDVNKTQRQVPVRLLDGRRVVVGTRSNRLLVGVFLRNRPLSMYSGGTTLSQKKLTSLTEELAPILADELEDPELVTLKTHGEAELAD